MFLASMSPDQVVLVVALLGLASSATLTGGAWRALVPPSDPVLPSIGRPRHSGRRRTRV